MPSDKALTVLMHENCIDYWAWKDEPQRQFWTVKVLDPTAKALDPTVGGTPRELLLHWSSLMQVMATWCLLAVKPMDAHLIQMEPSNSNTLLQFSWLAMS